MQLEHWGLDSWPFRAVLDVDHFYPSEGHDEAIARLEYLVEARRRLGVLVGESGVGKTLVLRVAAKRLARRGATVVAVDAAGVGTREFLWTVAAGLGTAPRDDADVPRLWRLVADRVAENRMQQLNTALLVDGAGEAGHDVLAQITRLARLESTADARWTIALVAGSAQAGRWNETLRELVDLRIDLGPWSEIDTIGYVQTMLVDAGRLDPIFADDALRELYELTNGVPRRVIRLAELSLLAGAARGMDEVDVMTVRAAEAELSWPATAEAY